MNPRPTSAWALVKTHSLYWSVDHPRFEELDTRVPKDTGSIHDYLAGTLAALEDAERMLRAARAMRETWQAAADALARRYDEELRPEIYEAMDAVTENDLRRARSEVAHFQRRVADYRKLVAAAQPPDDLSDVPF